MLNKTIILFSFIAVLFGGCEIGDLDRADRFYFRTDGADLSVYVDGNIASKTFVVLIHGGPGGSGHEYNSGQFTEDMEDDYAMVYYDQRGQGASQGNYSESDVTMQTFSNDLYNLVLALKGKYGADISVFLMGHSWGGTVGTHALLNTDIQSEVNGWLEVAGAHDIPLLYKASIEMFITIGKAEIAEGNNVEKWEEIVEFAEGVDTLVISDEESGKANSYGFEAEGILDQVNESQGGFNGGFLNSPLGPLQSISGNFTANLINPESELVALTGEMGGITIPVIFLWGRYDFVVPPRLAFTGYEAVGSTEKELVIFEHSGHSPMDNEPELFTKEVVDFVEQFK